MPERAGQDKLEGVSGDRCWISGRYCLVNVLDFCVLLSKSSCRLDQSLGVLPWRRDVISYEADHFSLG